jgi:hypothetical protein
MENDRDFGIVKQTVVGEIGEGLLLQLVTGLVPGAESLDRRTLALRWRHGSGSKVGIPVAEVVVVHVLVDILRIKLEGRLRRKRWNNKGKTDVVRVTAMSSQKICDPYRKFDSLMEMHMKSRLF